MYQIPLSPSSLQQTVFTSFTAFSVLSLYPQQIRAEPSGGYVSGTTQVKNEAKLQDAPATRELLLHTAWLNCPGQLFKTNLKVVLLLYVQRGRAPEKMLNVYSGLEITIIT